MRSWDAALGAHGLVPAQALLVPHDFVDRRQYLHARRTLTRLLELGTVPIINENDAIASDETRYGDNDRIAALVAHNIGAAVMVLLTDLDGLYTADPADRPGGRARRAGARPTTRCWRSAPGAGGSGRGSGGMASKLEAARIASWSGVRTVIADAVASGRAGRGRRRRAGRHVVRGPSPQARRPQAVDRLRLTRRRHGDRRRRRPAGAGRAPDEPAAGRCVDVSGRFDEGDTVDVVGTDGVAFARGMVFVEAGQLRKVAGRHTSDLPPGMVHEVIHRDDLVLLPAT